MCNTLPLIAKVSFSDLMLLCNSVTYKLRIYIEQIWKQFDQWLFFPRRRQYRREAN